MSTDISKVVVIGSSTDGWVEAQTILDSLTLPENACVIYIPHVHADDVYDHLSAHGKRVKRIEHGKPLEPGVIYVGIDETEVVMGWGADLDGFYGIKRELSFVGASGSYVFGLGRETEMPIDSAFTAVADTFGEASIGLILMGMQNDGAHGIEGVKSKNGATLSREPTRHHTMPYNAVQTGCVDYVLPVEEIGPRLEQLLG